MQKLQLCSCLITSKEKKAMKEQDEFEVVDLEHYSCTGKPIPRRVKYFLIKVDGAKIRVQSPISAEEILISAGLSPDDYSLDQRLIDGDEIELELKQEVDLRKSGVECFVSKLASLTRIIINGREKEVTDRELTLSELLKLAFDPVPTGENVCFTATFRKGPRPNKEGTLLEDESVKIKNGMVFNVTATDKS
jgi:hypothetical protein